MARYIDADELYRKVKTKTNPYGKPTLDYESGVKVLDMINQQHTADVVPKSEVERLQKAYNGLIADVKQNAIRDVCDICKHNVMFDDCEDCFTCKLDCPCRECKEGSNWKWRGER